MPRIASATFWPAWASSSPMTGPSPSRAWRRDVDGPADLVEEVIRIDGIDNVPSTPLPRMPGVARPTATPEQKLERKVRRAAARAWPRRGGDVELHQPGRGRCVRWRRLEPRQPDQRRIEGHAPVAAARSARRSGAQRQSRREPASGCSSSAAATSPMPSVRRSAWCWPGDKRARGWQAGKAAPYDAFDAKAEALALLAAAGAPVDNLAGHGRRQRYMASRPVGHAPARPEDRARGVRHGPSADGDSVRPRRPGRRGRAVSRRDPGQAG